MAPSSPRSPRRLESDAAAHLSKGVASQPGSAAAASAKHPGRVIERVLSSRSREEVPTEGDRFNRPSASVEIIDPKHYAQHGYPYSTFSELRNRSPVAWCEAPGFEPFWAITSRDDLVRISKKPEIFENPPLSFIAHKNQFAEGEDLNDLTHELPRKGPSIPIGA